MKQKMKIFFFLSTSFLIFLLVGMLSFTPIISRINSNNSITLTSLTSSKEIISETQANFFTSGDQDDAYICELNDTTFVVSWESYGQDGDGNSWGVYAIVFDSKGHNLTNEFLVNSNTTSGQYHPSISALNETTFVIVWSSSGQDGDSFGIYATVFDSIGNNLTNEFLVNTNTTNTQNYPSVSTLNETSFVVSWSSYDQDGSGYGVYATIFDSMGNKLTNEFRVNNHTTGDQSFPSVCALNDTTFVVSWDSGGQDGSSWGIYATIFDIMGNNLTSEFLVNNYTTSSQNYPSVSGLNSTTFVIAWTSYQQDGSGYGAYATIFNNKGINLTNEFRINTHTSGDQSLPFVHSLDDKTFIASWASDGQDGSSWGIYAAIFNDRGSTVVSEFLVNTNTTNLQYRPTVSVLNETSFVIVWESNGQDGDLKGIFFKGFSLDSQDSNNIPPPIPGFEFSMVGFILLVMMIVLLIHKKKQNLFNKNFQKLHS